MAKIKLTEAARLVGKSRNMLYRAIDDGKLSATLNHDGVKVVDTDELLRVYGSFKSENVDEQSTEQVFKQPKTHLEGGSISGDMLLELGELRAAKKYLEQMLADAQSQLVEAREEAKEAREEAREGRVQVMRLLEHRPEAADPVGKKKGRRSVIK